ncbi:lysophospholipid acyltransferase family protein [Clostridium hydrogenum]|uniref:lysophospholipid acyltransferase family protein n=1 Tax=Clostridium hydrogenum TaxID=2855764 RepID=UPI001F4302E5|nr:lysophospholipid acyltransferase family protein [Clostridium hydrogenum]
MRTIFFYIYFGVYMLITLLMEVRLNHIKKTKPNEEYEKELHKIIMKWSRNMLKAAGVTVNVKGIENIPDEPCVFVSNHQGNFDFLAMLAYIDKSLGFIAKKEILKLRIVSSWMKKMHCVFINREDIRDSLNAINTGVENVKNGYSMAIFPEGTRSKSSNLGEFKKGALKLATKANAPVVPTIVDGSYKIFEDGHGKIKSGTINVSFLKPIYIEEMDRSEKAKLPEILREKINTELENIKDNK